MQNGSQTMPSYVVPPSHASAAARAAVFVVADAAWVALQS